MQECDIVFIDWLMQRAKQLDALEVLLRQVTHDMNNALSVIQLDTESLPLPGAHKKIADMTAMIQALQAYLRQTSSS